jgi:pimeloyl-ACP methyl ester carboxylesterase
MKKSLIIFGIIGIIFGVVSFLITKIIYDQSFPRFDRHDDTINASLRYIDIEPFYTRELVAFISNENTLQGYVYQRENALGLVVISHGLGGGADSYLAYAKWFLDQGWSVFMYDATGSFDSEGDSTVGFQQSLIDLESALDYIQNDAELSELSIMLFGHSWGGYAVVNALHFDHDIKAVVSVAAPYEANAMIFEQTRDMLGFFAYTQYPFLSLYQWMLFGKYAKFNAIEAINRSNAHVMIIHGVNDGVFPYNGSAIIAKRDLITNEKVIFITRDDVGQDDHNNLFSSIAALNYVDELNGIYRTLYDEHEGMIPYEIKQAFYADVDRFLAQELDDSLMQLIHDMFIDALNE